MLINHVIFQAGIDSPAEPASCANTLRWLLEPKGSNQILSVPQIKKGVPLGPLSLFGGEAGIRTLGGDKPSTVFKTAAFGRSATSPKEMRRIHEQPHRNPIFLRSEQD